MTYLYEAITPTRIYTKQCPHCGKKYMGKTVRQDIEAYEGSGVDWTKHLKEHQVKPIHLWNSDWFYDRSICKYALDLSAEYDIVKSKDWFNLKSENGISGGDPGPEGRKKISETVLKTISDPIYKATKGKERGHKISKANKGKIKTPEHCNSISEKRKGKVACIDIITGEKKVVTKEEFNTDPNLVGIAKGNKFKMTEEQCIARRVPNLKKGHKLGDHALAKKVVVFGVEYDTQKQAMEAHGKTRPWLMLRLYDDRFPDCYVV